MAILPILTISNLETIMMHNIMFKAITLYECSPDSVIVNVLQRVYYSVRREEHGGESASCAG